MGLFKLHAPYKPSGSQPEAIEGLTRGLEDGHREQILLGVTGSGKTYTIANVIERVQKPTLVIAHNKTLAAQLCGEFKEFFPDGAVEYFVSYYDYYQPEAYIPSSDIYIEKVATVNDEIDKLRHSATSALNERSDVIIVASVSCIYALGDPVEYLKMSLSLRQSMTYPRDAVITRLVDIQYQRNDFDFVRGTFRVRGDTIEIFPSNSSDKAVRVEFFGDEIERIRDINVTTGEVLSDRAHVAIFPASHYAVSRDKLIAATEQIAIDLEARVKELRDSDKLVEAQRIEQRTRYDIEIMKELGYCNGIENYSRYFDGRKPGEPPFTLLDYFPKDFLLVIDESHVTVPQIRAMYNGDLARKHSLVDYGFRIPSAFDNRPLTFAEFEKRVNQVIYVGATPGKYELGRATNIVEQIIRPTGLVDPEIIVRPVNGQIDDLLGEIRAVASKGQRVLVTTLTKRMAENLTEYFDSVGVRVRYMHSEIETLARSEIIRDLRLGEFDVLVGINLLREGLDIPEVALVAILDADKEGFLRSTTSLIQTVGRAARNVDGRVIMYADKMTDSMTQAINETSRRRKKQLDYNNAHGITPTSVQKSVRDIIEISRSAKSVGEELSSAEKEARIMLIEKDMRLAAAELDFERAAKLRDELYALKGIQTENRASSHQAPGTPGSRRRAWERKRK